MNLYQWADAAWADGSFVPESWGEGEAPPAAEAQAAAAGYRFRPGYIAPRRKKKRPDEPPVVVEVAVERQEIKYVAVRQQTVFGPSVAPVMDAVQEVTRLIEARARSAEVRARIEELEEEEDIIIILSQLQ